MGNVANEAIKTEDRDEGINSINLEDYRFLKTNINFVAHYINL